jgi:hypothetical protein
MFQSEICYKIKYVEYFERAPNDITQRSTDTSSMLNSGGSPSLSRSLSLILIHRNCAQESHM